MIALQKAKVTDRKNASGAGRRLIRAVNNPIASMLYWVAAVVLIWEAGATAIEGASKHPEYILPHLSQIFDSVLSNEIVSNGQTALQIVLVNAGATLARAGIGFLIGLTLGFILALLMSLSGIVEKIAFPYLILVQVIPILGMAPIVLAITHDISISRIVIAAILTFYPVATNVLAGFKAVEKEKYDLMSLCFCSKVNFYTKTMIPFARPYFFTGLKISAPMAITASILVDTLQGDGGLGCMLSQSLRHNLSIYVFWQIVLFSAIIGILSVYMMSFCEMMVTPQKRAALFGRFKRRQQK